MKSTLKQPNERLIHVLYLYDRFNKIDSKVDFVLTLHLAENITYYTYDKSNRLCIFLIYMAGIDTNSLYHKIFFLNY